MIKIKPIIFSAGAAFVFSFFTALCVKSGFPIALLKAVIFAVVFGGLSVGVQVLYGMFLSDGGAAPSEPQEDAKAVGGRVDLVVSEEDLPEDKDAPAFFVDGKHVLSSEDVGHGAAAVQSGDGAISAVQQNEALAAAEKVREQKAAENIEANARQMAASNAAAAQAESEPEAKEVPAFAPIDLAAKSPAASDGPQKAEPAPAPAARSGDSELDELPDISGLGGGGGPAAAEKDDEVIEDSEFAQEGAVQVHRQTELADGKVVDVKDAPVMAEAIRTILKKEE